MNTKILLLLLLVLASVAHAAGRIPADMKAKDPALESILEKMDAVSRNNVIAAWEQTAGDAAARDAVIKAMREWREKTKLFRTATTVPATITGVLGAALGAKAAGALALGTAASGGLIGVAALAGVAAVYAADHYGRKMPRANENLRTELARIGDAARAERRARGTGDGNAPAAPGAGGTGNGNAPATPGTSGTGNGTAPATPGTSGTGNGTAPTTPSASGTGNGGPGFNDEPNMDGIERR
jgi:hypothetical protein